MVCTKMKKELVKWASWITIYRYINIRKRILLIDFISFRGFRGFPWSRCLRQTTSKSKSKRLWTSNLWTIKQDSIDLWPCGLIPNLPTSYKRVLGHATKPHFVFVVFNHYTCNKIRISHQNAVRPNPRLHLRKKFQIKFKNTSMNNSRVAKMTETLLMP